MAKRTVAKKTVDERVSTGPETDNPGRDAARDADDSKNAYIQYTKSKAKEKTHQAKLAEFKEKEARAMLIPARSVQYQADAAARMVKDAFMALPERVASVLVGATEQEIMAELRKEIRTILETIHAHLDSKR